MVEVSKEDILECSNLYVEVFNAAPWNDKWTTESAYQRLNDIFIAPNFSGVLFIENERIKGAIFGNYEQFYDGRHYNLREMFISTELQGRGIGGKLLNHLEKQLTELEVNTIILFTGKGKTSTFYSKNGFEEFKGMTMMGKDI